MFMDPQRHHITIHKFRDVIDALAGCDSTIDAKKQHTTTQRCRPRVGDVGDIHQSQVWMLSNELDIGHHRYLPQTSGEMDPTGLALIRSLP